MAKSIAGGVEIVNTLSTKNDGDYPLVKAESVGMENGSTAEEVINNKLDKNQGMENKGKPLVVGADGNVIPGETQGGGDINLDAEMREYMAVVKPKIKQSIINKGGTVLDTDSFKEYSKRIDEIPNNVLPAHTLPPQTNITAAAIDSKNGIQINWTYVGADGYIIIRKKDSKPTSSNDGDIIYSGAHKDEGILDTSVEKGNVYFYRIFPKNNVNQYQSIEEGSIVRVYFADRTNQKLLKDLEKTDEVIYGAFKGQKLKWSPVDKQDIRDGFVTFGHTSPVLYEKQFDAPENEVDNQNPDNNRKQYGNNRWGFSNARQWMNSDKPANQWFVKQHQYDVAPNYKNEPGFLNEFTQFEKDLVIPKKNKTFRCQADDGGFETTVDKIWLASSYEVGLQVDMSENAHPFEFFVDNSSRIYQNKNWWLRSINGIQSQSQQLRCVFSAGSLGSGNAISSLFVLRPFCQLPALAYVTWSDSDKAYIFADDSQRIGV